MKYAFIQIAADKLPLAMRILEGYQIPCDGMELNIDLEELTRRATDSYFELER